MNKAQEKAAVARLGFADGHMMRKRDRRRVRCQDCGRPSDVCEHSHWNTGNTRGVSFWYFCKRCARARVRATTGRLAAAGLLLVLALGSVGCAAHAQPVQVEAVGTLAAGPSVYSAPVHETTPPPSFEIAGSVDDDDAAPVVTSSDAGADAAPDVVAKGGGLVTGEVR